MAVDLTTRVGSVTLANPVMTASGTAGHGTELAPYGRLAALGAHVVKSLSAEPWAGNEAPRVTESDAGMVNSVGLSGPGVEAWLEHELPALRDAGATVVVSIWGRSVEGFAKAAAMLRGVGLPVVAVEVNVSCPNVEDRSRMFAHHPRATAEAVAASECGLPRWAKLSPNVPDVGEIAAAALGAGAEGLTLVNTLLAMVVDPERRQAVLGAGGGGLSGPPLRPVATRAIAECRRAFPGAAIVGVGGVAEGRHAAELLVAGADAVQVGTATFRDPRAPWRVLEGLGRWCERHGVGAVGELVGSLRG
ncbi:MAG: dihydroorotate dehydrogenase [Acidimicrobiales bacterium]